MNQIEFNIYPNITISKKIIKAHVNIIQLKLFESISLNVLLIDEDQKIQKVIQLLLDQSNGYNEWNTDKWLIDWIKKQIN